MGLWEPIEPWYMLDNCSGLVRPFQSEIRNPKSEIRNPKSEIQESKIQKSKILSCIAQAILNRHRNPADDRPHNADEALIGSTNEYIVQMGAAVDPLRGRAVHRAVVVPGETLDRGRREHIMIDDMPPEVGNKADRRSG